MKTAVNEMLGCQFPILAFSHCRDVVAAVSRAGGFGVLGAVAHTVEQLVSLGQDTERLVLSRAVKLWAENRVLLVGDKTTVFA